MEPGPPAYFGLKQYDKAEREFLNVIKLSKEMRSDYYYYIFLSELGDMYLEMKRYKEAEPLIIQSLEHFKEVSDEKERDKFFYFRSLQVIIRAKTI